MRMRLAKINVDGWYFDLGIQHDEAVISGPGFAVSGFDESLSELRVLLRDTYNYSWTSNPDLLDIAMEADRGRFLWDEGRWERRHKDR